MCDLTLRNVTTRLSWEIATEVKWRQRVGEANKVEPGSSGLGNEGRVKVVTSILRRVLPLALVDASVAHLEHLGRESVGGGCGVDVRTLMSRVDMYL